MKLSDTLKSKLKDAADMPINHDKTKDKSPTPSLKNSPKVQKKHPISPLDDRSFNNKESNHENDTLPSKQINIKIILKINVTSYLLNYLLKIWWLSYRLYLKLYNMSIKISWQISY